MALPTNQPTNQHHAGSALTKMTSATANKVFTEGLKNYPLSKVDNSPKMEFISGSKKVLNTIHADAPVKNFWSIVVYDPQTRSELQTGQLYPSKNSARGGFELVN